MAGMEHGGRFSLIHSLTTAIESSTNASLFELISYMSELNVEFLFDVSNR